jgi:hypothetical protein
MMKETQMSNASNQEKMNQSANLPKELEKQKDKDISSRQL